MKSLREFAQFVGKPLPRPLVRAHSWRMRPSTSRIRFRCANWFRPLIKTRSLLCLKP